MVAMSGAIMPAPLQKPASVTSAEPIRTFRTASFGNVSVVMMARDAASHAFACALAARSPSKCANRPASMGSPITPVEAM